MRTLRQLLAATVVLAVLVAAAVALSHRSSDPGTGLRDLPARALEQVVRTPTGTIGEQGGVVPDGSPLPPDADHPAVTNLDPALIEAVRAAARDAAADGVTVGITSGWRSTRYQQQLLDDAVAERGEAEARRWVATPETSRHVTGDAVDIGPTDAADWVSRKGNRYGLCQVYANELWHVELLTTPGGTCPPQRPDAAG